MPNTVVKMPQLGESVSEGTIGRWLKQPGEHVERDEPLVEIQTDKVNAEVPSPVAGILQQILLPEGTTAAIKSDMAIIGDEAPASVPPSPPPPPTPPPPATPAPAPTPAPIAAPAPAPLTLGATQDVALTPMRRAIAEHMTRARAEIPDAWSLVEIDVSRLVKQRDRLQAE